MQLWGTLTEGILPQKEAIIKPFSAIGYIYSIFILSKDPLEGPPSPKGIFRTPGRDFFARRAMECAIVLCVHGALHCEVLRKKIPRQEVRRTSRQYRPNTMV